MNASDAHEMERQIKELLKQKRIVHSDSAWSSSAILVDKPVPWDAPENTKPKKRLCIDYTNVNKNTFSLSYPMPSLDSLVTGLAKSHYLSTLDMKSGFWQLPMTREASQISSFSTPSGRYRWFDALRVQKRSGVLPKMR